MPNPDPIYQLYKQICEGGEDLLRQWMDEGQGESDVLDFKQAAQNKAPLLNDDKYNLSRALSGFSNSAGGVLVWGVKCKTTDGVNKIVELLPVDNVAAFETSLMTNCTSLCIPGAAGFEIKTFDSSESGKGYATVYIPKGEGEPVMAIAERTHRFYYRNGDSFLYMTQPMISDRFGRRPQPKLDLVWRQTGTDYAAGVNRIDGVLGIRNSGLGNARHVILKIPASIARVVMHQRVNFDMGITSHFRSNDVEQHAINEQICRLAPDFVIPSGLTFEFISMTITLSEIVSTKLDIPYRLQCEGHFQSGTLALLQEGAGKLVAV